MDEEIQLHTQIYPPSPTSFPIVWRHSLHDMVPPRFAVWYPQRMDFQIFDIARQPNHSFVLKPTRTDRTNPFYFAIQNGGDRQSRTVTLYKPRASKHTHVDVGIWFTGTWLCRRTSNRLQASIPILGVSDPGEFPFKGNIGIYRNQVFIHWSDDYSPDYVREIIHNRKIYTSLHAVEDQEIKPVISEMPRYVAELLIKDAVKREELCPITMEPITLETTAITSCFHMFERNGIQTWLLTKSECPVCKKACSLTTL